MVARRIIQVQGKPWKTPKEVLVIAKDKNGNPVLMEMRNRLKVLEETFYKYSRKEEEK